MFDNILKSICMILTAFIWIVAVAGCMTIFNINDTNRRERPIVYGGVRFFVREIPARGGSHIMGAPDFGSCINVLAIVDLPFSFVLDTILLPITIPMAISQSN